MIMIHAVAGNLRAPDWQARLAGARVDRLLLDQWEAQRSRFRKPTEGGRELAVTLDRGTQLRDGDVLVWDADERLAVVARIHLKEVMVVDLSALRDAAPEVALRTCVELGHALGNQHWPAVVKGQQVFVPLTVDRAVMTSVMRTHAFEGIGYAFVPGSEVIPYLAPHEARRVFGGAEGPVHRHTRDVAAAGGHTHDGAPADHLHER